MIDDSNQLREAIKNAELYICVACCKDELLERQDKINKLIENNYYPAMWDICSDDEIEDMARLLNILRIQASKMIFTWN